MKPPLRAAALATASTGKSSQLCGLHVPRNQSGYAAIAEMLKPYVVSMEGRKGILAITFEAENDVEAFKNAASLVASHLDELDATSTVEIMKPDATPIAERPTVERMARFAAGQKL